MNILLARSAAKAGEPVPIRNNKSVSRFAFRASAPRLPYLPFSFLASSSLVFSSWGGGLCIHIEFAIPSTRCVWRTEFTAAALSRTMPRSQLRQLTWKIDSSTRVHRCACLLAMKNNRLFSTLGVEEQMRDQSSYCQRRKGGGVARVVRSEGNNTDKVIRHFYCLAAWRAGIIAGGGGVAFRGGLAVLFVAGDGNADGNDIGSGNSIAIRPRLGNWGRDVCPFTPPFPRICM